MEESKKTEQSRKKKKRDKKMKMDKIEQKIEHKKELERTGFHDQ